MKKIKILSLHLGHGGIERAVITLANNLVKNNYEVEILSIYKLYDKVPFNVDEKVKITYLMDGSIALKTDIYKKCIRKFKIISLFKELFKDYKFNIFKLAKDTILSIINVINKRRLVIKNIKNSNDDVLISTRDFLNKIIGNNSKDNQITIGWEHNHHHGNMKYAKKIVNSVKKLNYFVLVSNDLKEFYSNELRGTNCKCVFIPNTLDFVSNRVSSLKEKRIISVGRLSKEKGYLDLLEMSKEIFKDNKDWKLDIVGDGSERETLEKYINDNNLSKHVSLLGKRDSNYINDLLSKSSIYLMTSYTESFGIVLIEAMNFGLPVIAFDDAEGAREIIVNNKNGYLIKNRNKKEYVSKVNELINNIDARIKLGKEGKENSKKYDPEIVYKKWIDLIK